MEINEKKAAVIFKALCEENRVMILKYLMSGEKCACRLLDDLNISQPTLSHHMKILVDSGLVSGRKDGKWMHYSISRKGLETAMTYLEALVETDAGEYPDGCCTIQNNADAFGL